MVETNSRIKYFIDFFYFLRFSAKRCKKTMKETKNTPFHARSRNEPSVTVWLSAILRRS